LAKGWKAARRKWEIEENRRRVAEKIGTANAALLEEIASLMALEDVVNAVYNNALSEHFRRDTERVVSMEQFRTNLSTKKPSRRTYYVVGSKIYCNKKEGAVKVRASSRTEVRAILAENKEAA